MNHFFKQTTTKFFLTVLIAVLLSIDAQAQLKVGNNPTTLNANAILEIESTNKGLLLPRVALSATNNPSPLTAHALGMVVYNTAAAGSGATAVSPGFYTNDGTKWDRMITSLSNNFQIFDTDANGKINNRESLTTSFFNLASSELTLNVPSGFSSNKVILSWDIWGDVTTSSAGTGSIRFQVQQSFNSTTTNIASIMMTGWSRTAAGNTRYSAPASIVLENLSPGTYFFRLQAQREDEIGTLTVVPNIYGIAAKGDVLVK
jgi:hypothetical protein